MNIIVCVKQVPEAADADLEINQESTDIEKEDLVMGMNEWDNYALEEAIRIKEAHGGRVTIITIGDDEAQEILRRSLAMGADEAIHIDSEDFEDSDGMGIARGLFQAIRDISFDLILTGAQSSDEGSGQVGLFLAELLGIPYASLVVQTEVRENRIIVQRELESNTLEELELPLPSLVTIQTGINDPRYVSIMGIRKVRGIEIKELDADELGLSTDKIGLEGSCFAARSLSLPQKGEGAEMLSGSIDDICEKTANIIKTMGGTT